MTGAFACRSVRTTVCGVVLVLKHKVRLACDPGDVPDPWIASVDKVL